MFGDKVHWFQRNIQYFFENPWKSSDRFTDSGRFKVLIINHLLLTSMQSFRNMILQKEKHGEKNIHLQEKPPRHSHIRMMQTCNLVSSRVIFAGPLLDWIRFRYSGQGLDKF